MLQTETISRASLYYGKYKYAIGFAMPDVHMVRYKSHTQIDSIFKNREDREYRTDFRSWKSLYSAGADLYGPTGDIVQLHEFLYFIENINKEYKIVTQRHRGHIYTNDITLVEEIKSLEYLRVASFAQVELRSANTFVLKNPNHDYRTYFKNKRISAADKEQLANFLLNQSDIRIGPGLLHFLVHMPGYHYIQSNYFIDHDNLGFLTMLQLICPAKLNEPLMLIKR